MHQRKTAPHRSIPAHLSNEHRLELGIFKLDVYAIYAKNPRALLYNSTYHRAYAVHQRALQRAAMQNGLITPPKSNAPIMSSQPVRGRRRGRPPSSASRLAAANLSRESNSASMHYHSPPHQPAIEGVDPSKPTVSWPKSVPLFISPEHEGYEQLSPEELLTCSTLRLLPAQYLRVKETLLHGTDPKGLPFKKREAQKMCRIDVNKTGKIYDWFMAMGWLKHEE